MAKKRQEKWLSIRASQGFIDIANEYTEATDMDKSQLVREAIKEYMLNHPIKAEPESTTLTKPGDA